jgi:hypothetical protein
VRKFSVTEAVAGTIAAALAVAGPPEAVAESLADLRVGLTVEEPLRGVDLQPRRPTSWRPLTITVDDTRQAMPMLLTPAAEWIRLPSKQPHELGDQVMFAATAHTEPASATAVNGIAAVTVDAGVGTVLAYAPGDERATWSAVELPRANTPVPYAMLPRRGRRGS